MTIDFDTRIQRRGTNSAKWDLAEEGTLPLWVADMDFAAPEAVTAALKERVGHGVFGYPVQTDAYYAAFLQWESDALGFTVDREWVLHCSAVMAAVRGAILSFSEPGDGVVVQPPVYQPFYNSITENGRRVVRNPLRLDGDRYTMDFDHLRQAIAKENPKLLLLCSPHNPVGRVWTRAELSRLAEICVEAGVVVVADEIHCGITYAGHPFVAFAQASDEAADLYVGCHSPSKTFNIAGVPTSQLIVPNGDLRRRLKNTIAALGHSHSGVLELLAAETAYGEGEPWRRALIDYLDGNRRWLSDFVDRELSGVEMIPLEGTYIPWLDFRSYQENQGLDDVALTRKLRGEGRVWLHEGPWFGSEGRGFQRVNIACPRTVLCEAMERIAEVLR